VSGWGGGSMGWRVREGGECGVVGEWVWG
jgi:hypothetical protein